MKTITLATSFIISAAIFFTSCTKQSEENVWNQIKTKTEEANKLRDEGKDAESKVKSNEAIELLQQFIKDYPSSEKLPEVYNNIAVIYMSNLEDYNNAVKYFKELTDKYPESKYTKYAMFMTGYIYDEMLKDRNKAIESFEKFLDKYPEDKPGEQFSFNSREILKMLRENRSVDEVIKSSSQNKDTTVKKKENDKNTKDTVMSKETK